MDQNTNSTQRMLLRAQFPKLNDLVLSLQQHQPLLCRCNRQCDTDRSCPVVIIGLQPQQPQAARQCMYMTLLILLLISHLPKLLQAYFVAVHAMLKQWKYKSKHCGLFAIATTFAFEHSSMKDRNDQLHMRDHLVENDKENRFTYIKTLQVHKQLLKFLKSNTLVMWQ